MNWAAIGTAAAVVSAGAAVASVWIAWDKNEREKATARQGQVPVKPAPLPQTLPATAPAPASKLKAFPTTYGTASGIALESEVGADYRQLQKFLAAQRFKEADQETTRLMLWVAHREQEGYLRVEDIEQFPCPDLRTIDQLWVQHSNGRFGFSVQKRIYSGIHFG